MTVEVIAEIGINHNGNVTTARRLIEDAAEVGADTVKFQLFDPNLLVAPDNPLHATLTTTCLSLEQLLDLRDYCRQCNVGFLCTPFSIGAVMRLRESGERRLKVSSADLTDGPLLYAIGVMRPDTVIISTGMATEANVRAALGAFVLGYERRDLLEETRAESIWRIIGNVLALPTTCNLIADRVVLMQCTSTYPARVVDANLRVLDVYRETYGTRVGLSDHTPSTLLPALAVAAGAVIIEKHLTFDTDAAGPDHASSLEPDKFADMVSNVRIAEAAVGTRDKDLSDGERATRAKYAKTLVTTRAVRKGEVFSEQDITRRRPVGDGLSPFMYWSMVGKRACHDYDVGESI